jgi:hypothetical protein
MRRRCHLVGHRWAKRRAAIPERPGRKEGALLLQAFRRFRAVLLALPKARARPARRLVVCPSPLERPRPTGPLQGRPIGEMPQAALQAAPRAALHAAPRPAGIGLAPAT